MKNDRKKQPEPQGTLFVTPLTYEGLIDEVLGIQTSSVSVRSSVIGRVSEEAREE